MERFRFGSPPLSLKLAFAVSLGVSFAVSCCCSSSLATSPSPQALAATDLLSFLAGARVPAEEASRLSSCLRYLSPVDPGADSLLERCDAADKANEKVMWPPEPVMELARLAVHYGGDPWPILRALNHTELPCEVPDIEGLQKNNCMPISTRKGKCFADEDINSYFAFLFELIVARGPSVGLNVSLTQHDLFHGHLFLASGTGRIGILFHAKEYPARDVELFPYNLGYCQAGSGVPYDDSMNLRNILWLAPLPSNETKAWLAPVIPGVLVVLDARPDGVIYQDMIRDCDYAKKARTIDEGDFGEPAVDVNYLNVANAAPADRIFIC